MGCSSVQYEDGRIVAANALSWFCLLVKAIATRSIVTMQLLFS